MINAPTRFIFSPSRAISRIVKRPLPNTTELGAVATGNIKAQLALIAAGTIITSGGIPAASEVAAKIGIRSVVLAVLDVVSVVNVTTRLITRIKAKVGKEVSSTKDSPKTLLKPEFTNPFAKQMPPANSSKTPQGIVTAFSHVNKRPPFPSLTMDMTTTANSATEASLALSSPSQVLQPPKGSARVIQAKAVNPKIQVTRFSLTCQAPT